MRTITMLALALALAVGLASAQETQHTIDIDIVQVGQWWVVDVEWAGDEPFSRETSTFDGRCSVPSDYYAWGHGELLVFPVGAQTVSTEHCGQLTWEADADGVLVVRGKAGTDGRFTYEGADGSVGNGHYYGAETGYDPSMGTIWFVLDFILDEVTGVEGLEFVAGGTVLQSLVNDIEALLGGTEPLIQLGQGTMSFLPAATD